MANHLQTITQHVRNRDEQASEKALSTTLSYLFSVYIKTLFTHWNYTGSNFSSIHMLLDTQYHEQLVAIDAVAERIRVIGYFPTNGSLERTCKELVYKITPTLSSPGTSHPPKMLQDVLRDLHGTAEVIDQEIQYMKKESNDEGSIDVLVEVQRIIEKQYWMLQSSYSETE